MENENQKLIDITSYPIVALLDKLLEDKTTKKNIIWATDAYASFGDGFQDKNQILSSAFIMGRSLTIRPRIEKNLEEQQLRTKKKAEVFTPAWLCNQMNNYLDEDWFGNKNIFNVENKDNTWTYNTNKIIFDKNKSWEDYIKTRCLEITCGEAPFLVSRYDTSTGVLILPPFNRIGLLDRKLRIVNENIDDEKEWIKWVTKAYQNTYGFEYQGDNLLIARINLLLSFIDYYKDKFNKDPELKLLQKITNIIAWNIWQMDGLKDTVPLGKPFVEHEQIGLDLFGDAEKEKVPAIPCVIKDWRANKTLLYMDCKENNMSKKLFDYVIGNPPYQEEVAIKETNNGMRRSRSIFQYFQIEADKIAISSVLIYPAVRWIHQGGKGMKDFGKNQINDLSLSKLVYYPNAKDVFPNIGITDGISIVVKNKNKTTPGFNYKYCVLNETRDLTQNNPGDSLMPLNPDDGSIVNKIRDFVEKYKISYLHDSVLSQKLFGIESAFVEENPDKVQLYSEDAEINYDDKIKLLANDKSGSMGRSKWYVVDKNCVIKNREFINKWKVVVISANPGGQRRDNQLEIIDNHSAFGRSKVALKAFDTKIEAENFFKYMDSDIIRYTLLLTNEALTSFAKYTPDILNYKTDNPYIDFSKNINEQLASLLKLNTQELNYAIKTIQKHRKTWVE